MIAATYDDMVIGMCTHFEMVPTPGGPVPTPIPHPFVAMIKDESTEAAKGLARPMTAAASKDLPPVRPVTVAGSLLANTGVVGKNASMLPHVPLPPGVSWAPMPKAPKVPVGVMTTPPPPDSPAMPAGDTVLHQGSAKMVNGQGAIVRLGDPSQNCSEPARQQATVLAIPKCGPVLVE
jgi:hypothetical protein